MNGAGPELRTGKAGKVLLRPDHTLQIFQDGDWIPIPYDKLRLKLLS
jgi:hypothetical protein